VNETIAVEARFETDGTVRVLAFERRGRRTVVAHTGRQWQTEDGRHILVMTPTEKVYELLYRPTSEASPWVLLRSLSAGGRAA
jgi:hypothetical protein